MHQGKQSQQQLGKSRNNYSLSKKKGNSTTLIGVVIIIFAIIIMVNWKSNLASSSTYPNVTGQYEGTIHDTLDPHAPITAWMKLSVKQNLGNISGNFTVDHTKLWGDGPFIGAVDAVGSIQFTVHSKEVREPLYFWGTVQSGENISGSYCSLNGQNKCDPKWGKGMWNVKRMASTSNINPQAQYTTQ
jgi:hypothetical protein